MTLRGIGRRPMWSAYDLHPPHSADAYRVLSAWPALAQLPPDDAALVEKARDCLLRITSAIGRFTQVDPSGRSATGTIYLKRPGRARFEYDPPSGLVVASNGFRVAVLDKRLGTLDAYPPGAPPPLGGAAARATSASTRAVAIETGSAAGPAALRSPARQSKKHNEGQIALDFSDAPVALLGWTITNAQGAATRVSLIDFAPSKPLPNSFFELKPDTPPAQRPAVG